MRHRCSRRTRTLLAGARGQALTEYALIIGGIAVVLIVGILVFAGHLGDVFSKSAPQGPAFRPPGSQAACDSHYVGGCIPSPPPKLDCADLRAFGITGVVHVVGGDPQGLDPDHDGIACD